MRSFTSVPVPFHDAKRMFGGVGVKIRVPLSPYASKFSIPPSYSPRMGMGSAGQMCVDV